MKKTILLFGLLLTMLTCGCGKEAVVQQGASQEQQAPDVVSLGGWDYSPNTRAVFLAKDDVTEEELRTALSALPDLRKLEYPKCTFSPEIQLALMADFPEIDFIWRIDWAGQTLQSDAKTLELSDNHVTAEELFRMLPLFPQVQKVSLGESTLSEEDVARLNENFPDTVFQYPVELFGRQFDSLSEELDLSGITMTDTVDLEDALVHFPLLKKVVMCGCGLKNVTMDELNRKYDNIRFVWLVNVFGHGVRTDATYFIQYNLPPCRLEGSRTQNLRYCPDMIAIDLGHTGLIDGELEFLKYTPHVKYLIVAACHLTDITEVGLLKELVFFEAFKTPIKDFTPLLDCPALTHLNLSYNTCVKNEHAEIFMQMDQLEMLWLCGDLLSDSTLRELEEALPDCRIASGFELSSTDGGWRNNDVYRDMRDAMKMPYMSWGYGNFPSQNQE